MQKFFFFLMFWIWSGFAIALAGLAIHFGREFLK